MAKVFSPSDTETVDLSQDTHIHTRLCKHASGDMEDYVLSALHKGLRTIVFLEHLEEETIYFERTWLTAKDFEDYFAEGRRLQEKYRDRLAIKLGVEVGYNPLATERLQEKLALYPWEHIGLSYHYYFNGGMHLNMVSKRSSNMEKLAAIGVDKILTDYFSGLIAAINMLECHTLCHLDAVMRHYQGLQFKESHVRQIDRILELLRQKNMSLEINTSGFAHRDEPYPGRAVLKKALDAQIPFVAGSDAHSPDQVGRYFDRLPLLLSSLR